MTPEETLANIDAAIDSTWEDGPDAWNSTGHSPRLRRHLLACVWRDGLRSVCDEDGRWTPLAGAS